MIKKSFCFVSFVFFLHIVFSQALKSQAVVINFNPNVNVNSEAAALFNLDADTTVYQKNGAKKMYPASTTKIMTYIVVVESVKDLENTKVRVPIGTTKMLQGTDSSVAGLKDGQEFTVKNLLESMMIPSGNDSSVVLANFVGQSASESPSALEKIQEKNINNFVDRMNEKAQELGCANTHFKNPSGLHDNEHFTTACDLIKMTKYALNLPLFKETVIKTEVNVNGVTMATTNYSIDESRGGKQYYPYANGIKTGYTDEAGRCLVLGAKKSDQQYICVILGDHSDKGKHHEDARNLCNWAFENLSLKLIVGKNKVVGKVGVNYAWKQDTLQLVPMEDVYCLLPQNVDVSSVNIAIETPKSVNAPINAGQKIGIAKFEYANQELKTVGLMAMTTVEESQLVHFSSITKEVFTSIWIKICIASIALFLCVINLKTLLDKKRKSKINNIQKYKKYKDQQSHRR
ncbi:MAG: D-alanyl-D-alanine carboxypeptidase [Oscillospiraceae bacterium]|jgi:D-alanyl-D-alanine carboxypeptidase (penicillin-binding protein 5/6)|nr:D-alanyl-D-alanine carboxypeptidase [Oscillospiraceae bacterium]